MQFSIWLLAAAPSDNRLQPVSTIAPPVTNIKQLFKAHGDLRGDTDAKTAAGKRDSPSRTGDKRTGIFMLKDSAGVKGQMGCRHTLLHLPSSDSENDFNLIRRLQIQRSDCHRGERFA